ncbi:MAG: glycosyltransferase [Actinomycetota bacterium]|nr:glycosyltransferase [Actinomycetota bacterium]
MSTDPIHDVGAMKVIEIELAEPLTAVSSLASANSRGYARALCLVRLHGAPLALVDVELTALTGPTAANELAERLWSAAGGRILEHLISDGLPDVETLLVAGLRPSDTPMCVAKRDAVRAEGRPASVVVATRDRPAHLRSCLRSLLELDYPDCEILVVDNAPTSTATRELVAGDEFRERITYLCEDRRGLASAHNLGLARANGDFVAFTDDDVTADRLWLLELARGFRRADQVACVTGLIVPAELETRAQLVAERLWGFNKGFAERVFDGTTHGGDPLYPYTAGTFGSGANMAFDVATLRSQGGFDPAIGIGTAARGGDDLSAFFTVIASGHRLVYNPSAVVHHRHHDDYEALRRQAFNYGVGLTAFLTKTVVDDPARLFKLARLGRTGFRRALDPRPGAAAREERNWPADLARAERMGMIQGPAAYLWSRLRAGRLALASGPGDGSG